MKSRGSTGFHSSQTGAALLLVMLIAVTLGLAFLFRQPDSGGGDYAREQATEDALAQAKAALIGYAATYRDAHPNEALGYLPCPDTDNTGFAQPNCGNAGETMVGRLPYKTLGLPDLRAADGECLWYVVSGGHKNNPKSPLLNWDARGQIRIQDLSGAALLDPNDASGGAVAAIVAPGAPLAAQNRPPGLFKCGGDATNGIASYLDGGYAAGTAGTLTLVAGQPRSTINNDRMVSISARELFVPPARRNDLLGTLIAQLTTCLNFTDSKSIPTTLAYRTTAGSKLVSSSNGIDEIMGLALRNCTLDVPATATWANWKDHFRYVVCSSPLSNCIQVNAANCSGAILFGGRFSSENPRTAAEKLVTANYFEAGNAAALSSAATAFAGNPTYDGKAPASDIAICLQPAPPALDFQSNFGDMTPVAVNFSGKSMITADAGSKTLTLGVTGLTGDSSGADPSQLFGCSWFGTTLPFGSGLRIYFRYEIINVGNGFVLAIVDADPSRNPSSVMCGRGDSSLGYSGLPNDGNAIPGLSIAPIQYPKIGLEIDTSKNIARNDPNNDHMAIVYWGDPTLNDDDNIHGQPTVAISGSPQNPAAVTRGIVRNTATGLHVRLEIVRATTAGGHNYVIKAWVLSYLPVDFDVLTANFDETIEPAQIHTSADIADLAVGNEALRNIRVGFTNAASATSDQQIQITNFAIRTLP